MGIEIRKITPTDINAVLELMREFAAFERLSQHLEVTEDRLANAMFGEDAFVQGLIAFDGEKPVGYAIFYPNFLTFRGQKGYFLEDLFVSDSYRAAGVGKVMLKRIAGLAVERGFERIDFLVLNWNEPAIRFYRNLGAELSENEGHFKFTDKAFLDLPAG